MNIQKTISFLLFTLILNSNIVLAQVDTETPPEEMAPEIIPEEITEPVDEPEVYGLPPVDNIESPKSADSTEVILDFYYEDACEACVEFQTSIPTIQSLYKGITINELDISNNSENLAIYNAEMSRLGYEGSQEFPIVVIDNEAVFTGNDSQAILTTLDEKFAAQIEMPAIEDEAPPVPEENPEKMIQEDPKDSPVPPVDQALTSETDTAVEVDSGSNANNQDAPNVSEDENTMHKSAPLLPSTGAGMLIVFSTLILAGLGIVVMKKS